MTFSKEQAEEVRKQLLKQLEQQPIEKKDQIKEYVKSLDEKQLEEFLKQNKIQISDSESGQPSQTQEQKPVFEQIIAGEIPSYKIAENTKAIAILEINPLSKGHSIVLPRKQTTIEKLPKSVLSLAQKIAKKIKKKLKPEDIKIETFSLQDYPAINIIPIYKNQQLQKTKAEESELKKLQNKLETKKRSSKKTSSDKTKITKEKQDISKLQEIGFRIPR